MALMVEVSTDTPGDAELAGRDRYVNLRIGETRVSMAPELAHQVADAIHAQAKHIEEDFPFRIVFK